MLLYKLPVWCVYTATQNLNCKDSESTGREVRTQVRMWDPRVATPPCCLLIACAADCVFICVLDGGGFSCMFWKWRNVNTGASHFGETRGMDLVPTCDSLPVWRLCLLSGLVGRVLDSELEPAQVLISWDWQRLLPWAGHWRAWAEVQWHQVGIEWAVGFRGILFSGDKRSLKTLDLRQQVVGPRRSKASSAETPLKSEEQWKPLLGGIVGQSLHNFSLEHLLTEENWEDWPFQATVMSRVLVQGVGLHGPHCLWEEDGWSCKIGFCCCLVTKLCPTLGDPKGCNLPGCFAHGMSQARRLQWVAVSASRRSSWPRDRTQVSCMGWWVLYRWVTRESPILASVQFSRSVVSNSLRPHESQHARPPCPLPTPGVHSDSRPSSQWCHPAISSSVVLFSSCP